MRLAIKLCAVACFAAIGSATFAQTIPNLAPFDAADTNHDGRVQRPEFDVIVPTSMKSLCELLFMQLDVDHNGWLSVAEYLEFGKPPPRH